MGPIPSLVDVKRNTIGSDGIREYAVCCERSETSIVCDVKASIPLFVTDHIDMYTSMHLSVSAGFFCTSICGCDDRNSSSKHHNVLLRDTF